MWNRPAGPPSPPITAVEELLEPHWPKELDLPLDLDPNRFPYARELAAPRFERSVFEPLQESQFANPQSLDRDGLVAFFGSMGWIGALPDEERLPLLEEVRSRLTANVYRLPFVTQVHSTRLADPASR